MNYDREEAELGEARRRGRPGNGEEDKELINSMNVNLLPQTAAREPVFVRHADTDERNQIMKTVAYSGHFYTTPDLVRPPGAEIEEGNQLCLLETGNPSGTIECDIRPQDHFITRFLTSTDPTDVPDTDPNMTCESSSWTALLTRSMSILGGGYGSKSFSESIDSNLSVLNSTYLLNNDQSFESYHTPPSSPCAGVSDEVSEVFVTPPPSPAGDDLGNPGSGTGWAVS